HGQLTSAGRQHTRNRMRTRIHRRKHVIQGYVTELSSKSGQGRIVVRTSIQHRGSPTTIQIETDELIGLGLTFGEWVKLELTEETRTDPLTGSSVRTQEFFNLVSRRSSS